MVYWLKVSLEKKENVGNTLHGDDHDPLLLYVKLLSLEMRQIIMNYFFDEFVEIKAGYYLTILREKDIMAGQIFCPAIIKRRREDMRIISQ